MLRGEEVEAAAHAEDREPVPLEAALARTPLTPIFNGEYDVFKCFPLEIGVK